MIDLLLTLCLSIALPAFVRFKSLHLFFAILFPLLVLFQISALIYNENYETIALNYAVPFVFSVTQISAYFAAFISFLWFFASIYTVFYITQNYKVKKLAKFMPFYNMAVCSSLLIAFASNLITTFIFYEILTLSTLPLVGFNLNEESRKSIVKYTFILSFTALTMFLPAIFIFQNVIGTTEFMPSGTISSLFSQEISDSMDLHNYSYIPSSKLMLFLLILLIFGVAKNAIFPFNGWLPAAMCAPAPVSALLHAVAIVKSGAFITYKIIFEFYGVEYFHYLKSLYQPFFIAITVLATLGIILASLRAIFTTDLKKILAFSTISNMTYIFLLFFTASESGMIAGFWHIAIHGVTKIGLFFIAGILYSVYHTNNYRRMSGAFNKHGILAFSMIVFSFSLMGLPLTSGFVSKQFMVSSLVNTQSLISLFAILFSTLATTIYLGKPLLYFISRTKKMILEKNIKSTVYTVLLPIAVINTVGFVLAFVLKLIH